MLDASEYWESGAGGDFEGAACVLKLGRGIGDRMESSLIKISDAVASMTDGISAISGLGTKSRQFSLSLKISLNSPMERELVSGKPLSPNQYSNLSIMTLSNASQFSRLRVAG